MRSVFHTVLALASVFSVSTAFSYDDPHQCWNRCGVNVDPNFVASTCGAATNVACVQATIRNQIIAYCNTPSGDMAGVIRFCKRDGQITGFLHECLKWWYEQGACFGTIQSNWQQYLDGEIAQLKATISAQAEEIARLKREGGFAPWAPTIQAYLDEMRGCVAGAKNRAEVNICMANFQSKINAIQ